MAKLACTEQKRRFSEHFETLNCLNTSVRVLGERSSTILGSLGILDSCRPECFPQRRRRHLHLLLFTAVVQSARLFSISVFHRLVAND